MIGIMIYGNIFLYLLNVRKIKMIGQRILEECRKNLFSRKFHLNLQKVRIGKDRLKDNRQYKIF